MSKEKILSYSKLFNEGEVFRNQIFAIKWKSAMIKSPNDVDLSTHIYLIDRLMWNKI